MKECPRFIRHILNGLFATVVHFAVLSVNLFVLHFESAGLANMIAALFGASASFVGSRYFVFRAGDGPALRQVASFAVLYGLIALMHGSILYVWTDLNGLDYRLGFIIATGAQVLVSYAGNKAIVFRVAGQENADDTV
ncbi:GtrA family protein [Luteimonas vadosa]|uniref:GtrA family protein n=1 Tax=Luteimonas vadosa TaxID=1165507 RepID=A0ABP9DNC0_9GAMM